jgi:hypothetical protein
MFGPGRAYEARGAGARRIISSSASVHAVAMITADSAKRTTLRDGGAFSHSLEKALRTLATIAKLPEVGDTTIYGISRSLPRSFTFYDHHAAAVSVMRRCTSEPLFRASV